jgi:hypothetical protein
MPTLATTLHARLLPTLYMEYINTMSLLPSGNQLFGLSGSLAGWIKPTGYHGAVVGSDHVPNQ